MGPNLVSVARPFRGPRWPQVRQTDRQTDSQTERHDKGALGLLIVNTSKLTSGLSSNFFSLAISSASG